MRLAPTNSKLYDPDAIPYFLWDVKLTVCKLKEELATGDQRTRDELVIRLLREANSRDVWLFLSWEDIESSWPRIEHRLGRARDVWTMMLKRRREHVEARDRPNQ